MPRFLQAKQAKAVLGFLDCLHVPAAGGLVPSVFNSITELRPWSSAGKGRSAHSRSPHPQWADLLDGH